MKRFLFACIALIASVFALAQPTGTTLTFKTLADMQAHVLTASQTNVNALVADTNRGGLFVLLPGTLAPDGDNVLTNTGTGRIWVRQFDSLSVSNLVLSGSGLMVAPSVATVAELNAYVGPANHIVLTDTNRGGLFKSTTDLLTVDNGMVFTNTAQSRVWRRVDNLPVNGKWYGMIGDGSTDCRSAFEAAVIGSALYNAGSVSEVYLPAGTYSLPYDSAGSGSYQITNSLSIIGATDGKTTINFGKTAYGVSRHFDLVNDGDFSSRNISFTGYQYLLNRDLRTAGIDQHCYISIDGGTHSGGALIAPQATALGPWGGGSLSTYRTNVVSDPGLSTPASWSVGTGWSVPAGNSTHTPGNTNALQPLVSGYTFTGGDLVRVSLTITGRTAGSVAVRVGGGISRGFTSSAVEESIITLGIDGDVYLLPTTDFDGTVDNVYVYSANWNTIELKNCSVTVPSAFAGTSYTMVNWSNKTLRSMLIDGCEFYGGNVQLNVTTEDNTITNAVAYNRGLTISNCRFVNNGADNLSLDANAVVYLGDNLIIRDSSFIQTGHGDAGPTTAYAGDAIYIIGRNSRISGNTFIGWAQQAITIKGDSPLHGASTRWSSGHVITGNTFDGLNRERCVLYADGGEEVMFINNHIKNVWSAGTRRMFTRAQTAGNGTLQGSVIIDNNTIVDCKGAPYVYANGTYSSRVFSVSGNTLTRCQIGTDGGAAALFAYLPTAMTLLCDNNHITQSTVFGDYFVSIAHMSGKTNFNVVSISGNSCDMPGLDYLYTVSSSGVVLWITNFVICNNAIKTSAGESQYPTRINAINSVNENNMATTYNNTSWPRSGQVWQNALGAPTLGANQSSLYAADLMGISTVWLMDEGGVYGPVAKGGVIDTAVVTSSDASTTNKVLWDGPIPAGVLKADGESITFKAHGTFAANTERKVLYVTAYDGTNIVNVLHDEDDWNGTAWEMNGIVTRTGATNGLATVRLMTTDALGIAAMGQAFYTNVVLCTWDSFGVYLQVRGGSTNSAADVVLQGAVSEYKPAK